MFQAQLPELIPTQIVTEESRRAAEEAILMDDIAREATREAAEAASRGMTVEEWNDYLTDLSQDAVEVCFQS